MFLWTIALLHACGIHNSQREICGVAWLFFIANKKRTLVRVIDIMGSDLMGSAKKKRSGDLSSLSRTRH